MGKKFARSGLLFALVVACAGGETGGSGSVLQPTTVGITSVSAGNTSVGSDSSDSDGATDSGEAPTTGEPASTGSNDEVGTSQPAGVCGDDNVDPGEDCDGESLVGSTCQTEGFGAGKLVCGDDCKLFTDGCYTCGDGFVHMAEACDGTNFNGKSCQSLGYGGGNLVCAPDCKSIDTAGCTPLATCGNGVKEGSEVCDGAQLGGQSCVGLGYDDGQLFCSPSCTFDTSACITLACSGQGEFCIFNENDLQSNCCPAGVKGNVLGICDIFICL